jgi:hypothetical protein
MNMLKSLEQACTPRKSVFDPALRDTVYNIDELGKVDPKRFFAENYVTDGMRQLLTEAFRRLEGRSQSTSGAFLLSQAMGGGKTHNLLALGLLAMHPGLRAQVMGDFYTPGRINDVRVVAFSGRNTKTPLGLWGEIAEGLQRKQVFKDFYSPLIPPSEDAWVELLHGDPVLILLDELPPYFEAMRAKEVGATTLDQLTTVALANLFTAIANGNLPRACLVLTDLRSTAYSAGSAAVNSAVNAALQDLEGEANRTVVRIDPVRLNTDELYHILRTRLFERVATPAEADAVAAAYGQAVAEAHAMGLSTLTDAQARASVKTSYPFHPGIRDLFARFKENPRFQQTRALLRIMRTVVADLWQSHRASQRALIGAEDINLLDVAIMSEIRQINNSLEAALAHDIASEGGQAVAQRIDGPNSRDARDVATLIFLSSLSQAVNPTLGLTRSDINAYLAAPGRDITRLRDALDKLQTQAWYLHAAASGALLFKNTENLNAKLESYAQGMLPDLREAELRARLEEMFAPRIRACYAQVQALPALDQVQVSPEATTLIIFRPAPLVRQDIERFFEHLQFKNRVLFLTGDTSTYDHVLERSAYLRAIAQIIAELVRTGTRESDPQMEDAKNLETQVQARFYLACREAFRQLLYPWKNGLADLPVDPQYAGNSFNGEQAIIDALTHAYKYEPDAGPNKPDFVDRIVTKLWSGAQEVPWNEVRTRAATDPSWVWHHPRALEDVKAAMLMRDQWRDIGGGFIQRGPFPPPAPSVQVQLLHRDDRTGEVTLRVRPLHGDVVYETVTTGSATVNEKKVLDSYDVKTSKLHVTFTAANTAANMEGDPVLWTNIITMKHRLYGSASHRMCELQAMPSGAIRFTTDGSSPATSGQPYRDEPFPVPRGCNVILAQASAEGITSDLLHVDVPRSTGGEGDWRVDPAKPATWRKHHKLDATADVFTFLDHVIQRSAQLGGVHLVAMKRPNFADLSLDEATLLTGEWVRDQAMRLRELIAGSNVTLDVPVIISSDGQHLLELANDLKDNLKRDEVVQP